MGRAAELVGRVALSTDAALTGRAAVRQWRRSPPVSACATAHTRTIDPEMQLIGIRVQVPGSRSYWEGEEEVLCPVTKSTTVYGKQNSQ